MNEQHVMGLEFLRGICALALFFGGMAIAISNPVERWSMPLVFVAASSAMLFLFVTADGGRPLVGLQGIANFAPCLLVFACFFRLSPPLRAFLGQTSYGMCLLHPLIWGFLHSILKLPLLVCILSTVPISLASAWLLWNFYESPAKRGITRTFIAWRNTNRALA